MSLEDAEKEAFSFGRNMPETHNNYSIGVYGIGMKRAVFKLGEDILIRSTHSPTLEEKESFTVPIKVNEWVVDDRLPWDFEILDDEALEQDGVEIIVKNLTPGAESSFDSPAFLQNLRRIISRDYSLHINRGIKITLNGEVISGWKIELRQSDDFEPMRIEYEDSAEGDRVLIEVIGGMAAPPPETSEPDENDESDRRFGWYVICNGRIVLAADKTEVSGWGTEGWPRWHRQYSGFIGLVLFTSEKASALPLTTTKRSVDTSSEVFRRARPRLREVTRMWIDYTNQRKQSMEEAKKKEAEATAIPVYSIQKRPTVTLPKLIPTPAERIANINYAVPVSKLKKLAKELGNINMPYREVGIKTFDYTYDDLMGEE
ncbi:ATP-binding protein [Halomonas sp. KM-1]|uniref:ATP-binding protein n=1 Tax=Halomonas sp. KM-1 TaxID=590061 RepID=UPI0002FF1340|nr:ATP-binding protein [Halomonas sp. KM-1]